MVIAMDGPACSGKSTLAVEVANKIGFHFLNTGMIFRAITYLLLKNNIDITNNKLLHNILNNTQIDVEYIDGKQIVYVNGEDTSNVVSSPEVAKYTSPYSQNPIIRQEVVKIQRNFSKKYNLVIEGRDIGTEVFPDAKYKFFITASIQARTNRRYETMKVQYPNITKKEIQESLLQRDFNDSTRKISPLRQADDAVLIDTSNDSIEESINKIISHIDKQDII